MKKLISLVCVFSMFLFIGVVSPGFAYDPNETELPQEESTFPEAQEIPEGEEMAAGEGHVFPPSNEEETLELISPLEEDPASAQPEDGVGSDPDPETAVQ